MLQVPIHFPAPPTSQPPSRARRTSTSTAQILDLLPPLPVLLPPSALPSSGRSSAHLQNASRISTTSSGASSSTYSTFTSRSAGLTSRTSNGSSFGGSVAGSRAPSFSKSPSLQTIAAHFSSPSSPPGKSSSSRSRGGGGESAPHPFAALTAEGASSNSTVNDRHHVSSRALSLASGHSSHLPTRGAPPLALIVSTDMEEVEAYKCPVCVERMGADFRIQGEKPDVVPECGHAVHHVRPLPFSFVRFVRRLRVFCCCSR
jgi:hypothetical protein